MQQNLQEMPYEAANRKLAYEAAAEGMVLLRNDQILPLETGRIGLIGSGARKTIKGGTGSGDVNARYSVNIEEGLENAGYTVMTKEWLDQYDRIWEEQRNSWKKGIQEKVSAGAPFILTYFSTPFVNPEENLVQEQDVNGVETVVYVLGRSSGEGTDRRNVKGDFLLSESEEENIRRLCAYDKNIILVINAGGLIDLSFTIGLNRIKGIIYMSQAGMDGGNALADILKGKICPSGRLTDTWGMRYDQWPSFDTYGMANGNLEQEEYTEGIFVGYRWFDSMHKEVLYPFGYGLSYTDFSIAVDGHQITVTNTGGQFAGKEIVQIYAAFPRVDGVSREDKSLISFHKTGELKPGESETFTPDISIQQLSRYDEEQNCWIVDPGIYRIMAGNNAANLQDVWSIEVQTRQVYAGFWPEAQKKSDKQTGVEQCEQLLAQLTDDDMIALVCGKLGGSTSTAGAAGQKVAGAAAETVDIYDEGKLVLAGAVMADGPAGLRLAQHYQTDRNGKIYLQDIESAIENGYFAEPVYYPDAQDHYQYCTAFPIGTLIAQTWNMHLAEAIGRAVGEEMKYYGVALWLAPGMNIHRNPLCGRNFEYYSEDPYLTGMMASAIVKGVQSHPGLGATIKHYACNNQEDNRKGVDCLVAERALREIYLKGFEIAVKESQPMAIMTSYNKINGVYSANSRKLCEEIARKEWGYTGVFMTDWTTTANGAVSYLCMKAGNDLIMPGSVHDHENIRDALQNGQLNKEELRACARRIIRMLQRTNGI